MLYSFATSSLVRKNDQTSYAVLRSIASGCAKNIQIVEQIDSARSHEPIVALDGLLAGDACILIPYFQYEVGLGYEANQKTTALYFNDLTAPGTTESH